MTTLVTASYRTLESDGRNENFSRSWSEDIDISGKGADDDISHYELLDPESDG